MHEEERKKSLRVCIPVSFPLTFAYVFAFSWEHVISV